MATASSMAGIARSSRAPPSPGLPPCSASRSPGTRPQPATGGSARTIARWADAGIEVSYGVLTDGDAGGFDPTVPRSEIPAIRRAEQEAAAKVVGVDDVTFLGYPDGRLFVTSELRRDISRVIR